MPRSPSTPGKEPRKPASAEIAEPLLAWFARNQRALPWRTSPRDPYRTWLAEVMLQQTRVDVVVPYWLRFVARHPSLRALAEAPEGDVLALWSGLGYYARARNLHRAAQAVLRDFGGALPRTSALLAGLPGFGPYTAAAVASLAFGEQVALVDGNVARVLARLLRLQGDAARVRSLAWTEARALLPKARAGPFNEALMELGATVCTPRAPDCARCPLSTSCRSFPIGDAEDFPARTQRKERPLLRWAAVALRRDDGALLLARRPADSLFAGLWDLPSAALPASTASASPPRSAPAIDPAARPSGAGAARPRRSAPLFDEAVARTTALSALAAVSTRRSGAGIPASRAGPPAGKLARQLELTFAGAVAQTLTHREVEVAVLLARPNGSARATALLRSCFPEGETLRWTAPTADALRKLGLSSLARKCLRAAGIDWG